MTNNTLLPEEKKTESTEENPEPKNGGGNHSIQPEPLQSVHTTSFPQILKQIAASVLVTTYQAGKLIVLRNDADVLNTHFRNLSKPMGLARAGGKLAIGCSVDIWEYHNVPAVCGKLDESDDYPNNESKHDACFLPRRSHCTGDIQIHEMAWQDKDVAGLATVQTADREAQPEEDASEVLRHQLQESELIFVNTAFSCLAKRSDENSFEPIWKPNFIKQLIPGDNCHLNGLAMRNGQPAFVTALGDKDEPGSWRENKRDGGIIIDVDSNEIIARGLSMPHSPRWYNDQLWVLESGDGSIGTVDLETGEYKSIAQFPGFTRGLSFYGPLAFIGLSQVRESATFSGIPLVDRLKEAEDRTCGVWVLNIETGETLGFCRFEADVQEIFAVEAMPGIQFPDLVNHDPKVVGSSYVLSDVALQSVPEALRN